MNLISLLIFTLLGAAVGSFVNAVVWRVRRGLPFVKSRSVCDHCGHQLAAADLIPVVSYLLLHGKCRYCGKKLSLEHPSVEIATAVLFAASYYEYFTPGVTWANLPISLSFIVQLIFITLLMILLLYDLKYMEIPNRVVLGGIVVAVVLDLVKIASLVADFQQTIGRLPFGKELLADRSFVQSHIFDLASPYLYGALAGVALAVIFFVIVYLSKERAMGGGDIKLALLLGLVLPWPYLVPAMYIGFILGAVVGVGLVVTSRKKVHHLIPLAPFLVVGTLAAMFYGSDLFRLLISVKIF